MSATQELGAFVARVGTEGVSEEARSVARTGFADCIASMIAGSREAPVTTLMAALASLPAGQSQLWFGAQHAGASDAELINGVAAHALDFDDVALRGHPSAVLVPAIVAVTQQLGSSGARRAISRPAIPAISRSRAREELFVHRRVRSHARGRERCADADDPVERRDDAACDDRHADLSDPRADLVYLDFHAARSR